MAFAIKVYNPKRISVGEGRYVIRNEFSAFYCQTLLTLTKRKHQKLIILSDGSDADEVDISYTLIDAEKKIEALKEINKKYVFKVVEYPEGSNTTQEVDDDDKGSNSQ